MAFYAADAISKEAVDHKDARSWQGPLQQEPLHDWQT